MQRMIEAWIHVLHAYREVVLSSLCCHLHTWCFLNQTYQIQEYAMPRCTAGVLGEGRISYCILLVTLSRNVIITVHASGR